VGGSLLIKALIRSGVKYSCSKCHNQGQWKQSPLKLQLDHINGNPVDNRKENLRILCPNCHSQTETFCGKKNKAVKDGRSRPRPERRKVERPSKKTLRKLLWEFPTSTLGKQFGVSDKAIEKWAKTYGIPKPPLGYWAKNKTEQGRVRQRMLNHCPKGGPDSHGSNP
jgi:hypothetical protein